MKVVEFNTVNDYLRFFLPFSNEVCNVLTMAKILSFYNHHAFGVNLLKKTFIDLIALVAIVWNTAYITYKTQDSFLGLGKGIITLIVSFIIPNLFMHNIIDFILKITGIKRGMISILIIGFIIILLLLGLELLLDKLIIYIVNKNKKHVEKISLFLDE